jgi:hypothetical protein
LFFPAAIPNLAPVIFCKPNKKPKKSSQSNEREIEMGILQLSWNISGMAGIFFVVLPFCASGNNIMPSKHNQEISTFVRWFSENGAWYRFVHFPQVWLFCFTIFHFYRILWNTQKNRKRTLTLDMSQVGRHNHVSRSGENSWCGTN